MKIYLKINNRINKEKLKFEKKQNTGTLNKYYEMYKNMYNELSHNNNINKTNILLNEIIQLLRKNNILDEDLIEYYKLFQHVLNQYPTYDQALEYIFNILNNSKIS